MKKLLSLILAGILLLAQIVPASATVNPANQISFKARYITVKADKVIVEGTLVNDNNRETVCKFEDFFLDMYYEGELIFSGYAGDFDKRVRAGRSVTVKLIFARNNYETALSIGEYDVWNLVVSDIGFTCTYY